MPTQDDIEQQQQLLATHRRTLAHLLDQQARFSAGHVPAHVATGIAEARAQIAQIKATLRGCGQSAPDMLGDVASTVGQVSDTERYNRQMLIRDMRQRFAKQLESAPKLIRLRLAERLGAVEPPGALIRPYDIACRRPGQADAVLPARPRIVDLYDEHNAQLDAADAASGEQDRSFFESWNRPERFPDLLRRRG
jgi:hypothetical protein